MNQTLLNFVPLIVELCLVPLFIGLMAWNYRSFWRHWKAGLGLGGMAFLLTMPATVLGVWAADWDRLLQGQNQAPTAFYVGVVIGLGIALCIHLFKIVWYGAIYGVAVEEWSRIDEKAFPVNRKVGEGPAAFAGKACLLGIGVGVASMLIFHALGVGLGDAMLKLLARFPRLNSVSPLVQMPCSLFFVLAAALTEEIVFRGAFLGFLLRLARGRKPLIVIALVVVSLAFALLHIPNTNAPVIKCTQIFLLGLFFGELARRKGFESAVAAHVGLNIGATLMGFAMM